MSILDNIVMSELGRETVSYEEAKSSGLIRYFTGLACKHGHVCQRYTRTKACIDCNGAHQKKYHKAHPEKASELGTSWVSRNREAWNQYCNQYNKDNRRRRSYPNTPSWADRSAIKAIYVEAKRMSDETGILHHVDHIIPRNGKLISGLHVPENLQILTAVANMAKGNQWPYTAE